MSMEHTTHDHAAGRSYPVFIDMDRRAVTVIGGGGVAERKIAALIGSGALLRVVSPSVTARIERWHEEGSLLWIARSYAPGDIAGAFIAFAATGDGAVNRAVAEEARACGALVNVIDDPDTCDFTVPATVSRGQLRIAVSTSGTSPTLAHDIRTQLEKCYGEEYASYTALLGQIRALAIERVDDPKTRRALIARSCDGTLLKRIRDGESPDAQMVFETLLAEAGERVDGKEHL